MVDREQVLRNTRRMRRLAEELDRRYKRKRPWWRRWL